MCDRQRHRNKEINIYAQNIISKSNTNPEGPVPVCFRLRKFKCEIRSSYIIEILGITTNLMLSCIKDTSEYEEIQ